MKSFLIKGYFIVFIIFCTVFLWNNVHASEQNLVNFNLSGGTYMGPQQLVMSSSYGGAIYYTVDYSEPNLNSNTYTSPITIYNTTTIKAKAYRYGTWGVTNQVTIGIIDSSYYSIFMSPSEGCYSQPQHVTLMIDHNRDGVIRYTTDGSEPNIYSKIYTSSIYVDRNMVIKAKAYSNGVWSRTFIGNYIILNPYWDDNRILAEARGLFDRGLYDQSISIILNLLERDKENEDALLLLMDCYIQKGDFEAAKYRLTHNKYIFEYPRVINRYAEFCNREGQYQEAREKIMEILPQYPEENYLYKTLAQSYKGLHIRGIRIFVYGEEIDFSDYDNVRPMISEGRTLVPIRALSEAIGAKVEWDRHYREAHIYLDNDNIELWDRKKFANVNGEKVILDVPAFIYKGRLLVPIRFVSEQFGRSVEWFGVDQTVNIISIYD